MDNDIKIINVDTGLAKEINEFIFESTLEILDAIYNKATYNSFPSLEISNPKTLPGKKFIININLEVQDENDNID